MRYRKCWVVLFLFCCTWAGAQQNNAIRFQAGPFAGLLKQSKTTGKMVFVDCYTSWCMPCKWMDVNVFTNDTVATFYNSNFINSKIDMEKGEGIELKKKYNIEVFPTYLFLNGDGTVMHRTTSRMEAAEFLQVAKTALNPEAALSGVQKKYEAGERSLPFLFDYHQALLRSDRKKAEELKKEIVSRITDAELLTPFGWRVIQAMSGDEQEKLGKFLIAHRPQFEKMIGAADVHSQVNLVKIRTMYGMSSRKDSAGFFSRLYELKKDTSYATRRTATLAELGYYENTKDKEATLRLAKVAMNGLFKENAEDLGFVARSLIRSSPEDPRLLQQAYDMARRGMQLNPEEYTTQSTYAQACLVLKRKEEGLVAAKKALKIAEDTLTSKIVKIVEELIKKLNEL